jgi:hypothetical protein
MKFVRPQLINLAIIVGTLGILSLGIAVTVRLTRLLPKNAFYQRTRRAEGNGLRVPLAGTQSLQYKYQYHPPMIAARNAGVMWTDENLYDYLEGPEAFFDRRQL